MTSNYGRNPRSAGPAFRLTLAAFALLLLSACNTTQPPPSPPQVLDVEGLWLVDPAPGTFYGAEGTTTLEFGAARSGSANFLSRNDVNDILTCERHVYAAISANVLLLDGTHYVAQKNGPNEIELSSETSALTLTRVSGAPPVEPCIEVEVSDVDTFAFGADGWTSLSSIGTRLYFNTDETGSPIVGFNTTNDTLVPERINPGNHDHLVAARSDDEFYGHCACGNITTLQRFNITNPTALASISSQTDLGIFMSVENGFFDGTSLVIAGRDYQFQGVNHVLTLNADTLALEAQRDVLPEAFISDIAWTGSQLAALVANSIVLIGNDGKAEATIDLPASVPAFPEGLAVNGSDFYVLARNAANDATLFQIPMP